MFKVGDKVYSIVSGYGVVTELQGGPYPLVVEFDRDSKKFDYSFTLSGAYRINEKHSNDLCPPVRLRWRPNVTASGLLMGYTARYKDKVISLHFNSGVMSIVENGKIKPITMKELRSMLNET